MHIVRKAVVVACAVVLAAILVSCGEDGDSAQSKDAWQEEHADLIAAYEKDLDAAGDTINRGEKQATISACTQLSDDAKEIKDEALPVPNPAVDGPLRQSVDIALTAADNCIQGGRTTEEHGARRVEAAMKELTDAHRKFLEAKAAIEAWED
ncbi:MAG: hypothetical protein M3314_12080 [Actinomycetota bacterium]|nr:hypothetical protein [Actinomycetota bacterium]